MERQAKLLVEVKRRLRDSKPYIVAREIKRVLEKHLKRGNGADGLRERVASLKPDKPSRGNVLLSYKNDAFFLKDGQSVSHSHTNCWESLQIARIFCDLGYCVDVIDENNSNFLPSKEYSFFIDNGNNTDRIVPRLNKDCVKILHIDGAHWLFHTTAQSRRLLDLQQRKGITLSLRKGAGRANWAIEHADCATMLGNDFTAGTYGYANKPIFRTPISTPVTYLWPEAKDFDACRRSFLWFGGRGFVHKGLDLVLEAFAGMPEYHLTVCGPIRQEKDFNKTFDQELYQTPNIHAIGWVDIAGPEFVEITNRCIGLVYASCSEGQCGSVVTGMHASLIPIVSYQSGVDVEEFGLILRSSSIEEIRASVRAIANLSTEELKLRARKAWEFARRNHTREKFAEEYRKAAEKIIANFQKD